MKASSCNVLYASSREAETDVPSLTDSEEETIVLTAKPNQLMAGTRSGQSYLKKYDEMAPTPPKPATESAKYPQNNPWRDRMSLGFSKLS